MSPGSTAGDEPDAGGETRAKGASDRARAPPSTARGPYRDVPEARPDPEERGLFFGGAQEPEEVAPGERVSPLPAQPATRQTNPSTAWVPSRRKPARRDLVRRFGGVPSGPTSGGRTQLITGHACRDLASARSRAKSEPR